MSELSAVSAPPQRAPGTRSRAGNAMERTRVGVLDGALRCLEKQGTRKTTMGDIAALGGIAKATLYNHFRRKDDVFAALLAVEVQHIAADCTALAAQDLAAALKTAADRIAEHPAVRRVAAEEPAVLAQLVSVGDGGCWPLARTSVADALEAAGKPTSDVNVDFVLRWLVSHLAAPGSAELREAQARRIALSLPPALASTHATG